MRKIYSENLPLMDMANQKDVIEIEDHASEIKENIAWMAKTYQPMKEWFESQMEERNEL